MALIGSDEAKDSLKRSAKSYTLDGWRKIQIAKLGGVGALTGLFGGLVGLEQQRRGYPMSHAGKLVAQVGLVAVSVATVTVATGAPAALGLAGLSEGDVYGGSFLKLSRLSALR
jgi:hypothetical protein